MTIADTLASRAGELCGLAPCYVYDKARILREAGAMQKEFSGVGILYSVKANPHAPLLALLARAGLGADAAPAHQGRLALEAGFAPGDIFYSAPGKTRRDLERTLGSCTIIADSLNEVRLLADVSCARGQTAAIGVRLAPDFGLQGAAGQPSKFGIALEDLGQLRDILEAAPQLRLSGLHLHLQSQMPHEQALKDYYARACRLFARACAFLNAPPGFLNFGSGISVAYNEQRDRRMPLEGLGEALRREAARRPELASARLLIESGRRLVCEAGTYLTPVVDIKRSCGKTFVIVQGGANGFLRPEFAALALEGKPAPRVQEPFFTAPGCFCFDVLAPDGRPRGGERVPVELVGNLCTACDTLGHDVLIPGEVAVGDLVAVSNAGSYARSLSALAFAGHEPPREVLL